MKQAIYNFYGIIIYEIDKKGDNYYFSYKNDNYIFVRYYLDEIDIKHLKPWIEELNKYGLRCHTIITNTFNNHISSVNNKKYVLLKLNRNPYDIIDITGLISFQKKSKIEYNKKNEWGILWQKKVDYLEKQLGSFGRGKNVVINSFSYYIGLAENAISYFNSISEYSTECCVNHRRVFYPNYWISFGNPLSFLIDVPERDEAEFLKHIFFYGNNDTIYYDLDFLLKYKKRTPTSAQLLLSRLLFPTYYFDLIEEIFLNGKVEEKLILILNKRRKYEEFLLICFNKISSVYAVEKLPDWLL